MAVKNGPGCSLVIAAQGETGLFGMWLSSTYDVDQWAQLIIDVDGLQPLKRL